MSYIYNVAKFLNINPEALSRFNDNSRSHFFFLCVVQIALHFIKSQVKIETLTIIKDLGIQIQTETLGGSVNKQFHDISRIRDFIINEHVTFYYVR